MTAVVKDKKAGGGFGVGSEFVRIVYDFDADAGATGVLDLFVADGACVIKSFHAVVKTTFTSGGSATLTAGVQSGDVDVMLAAVAVASLTANSVHGEAVALNFPIYLADGGILQQNILVAAMTAGKIEYVIEVMKV